MSAGRADRPADPSTQPPSPAGTDQPIPARAWAVLGVCSATVLLTLLDSGSMFIAFPFVKERFADQASQATLSWVVSSFFIVMVSILLVAGRLADRFGRRRVFLIGLVTYATAGLVAASTVSVGVLIAARCFQGLGVGLLSPSSLSLALPEFPVARRAFALGVWGTIGALAGLVSAPIGAVLVDLWTWRSVFFSNAGLAMVMFVIGLVVLDDEVAESDRRPIDVVGAVLATVTVAGLALVLVQGGEWGWTSSATLVVGAVMVGAAPAFWWRNSRHPSPVIEPAVFADRRFGVASVASVCCQLGFFSVYFGMPLYMTEVWDWSALQVGLGLLPFNAVPILTAMPAGRIVDRHGPRGMMAFGGVLTAACYIALGLWIVDLGYTWVAVTLVISGLGAMAIGSHTTIAALRGVDDAELGAANAGYFMTRRLGSALGAVATAAIVGNRTGAEFAGVFVWVWMFGAAAYLIGGLAVWFWYPSGRHEIEAVVPATA